MTSVALHLLLSLGSNYLDIFGEVSPLKFSDKSPLLEASSQASPIKYKSTSKLDGALKKGTFIDLGHFRPLFQSQIYLSKAVPSFKVYTLLYNAYHLRAIVGSKWWFLPSSHATFNPSIFRLKGLESADCSRGRSRQKAFKAPSQPARFFCAAFHEN